MPNIVKIGKTERDDVRLRMDELYRGSNGSESGVPYPFDLFYACEVDDVDKIEKGLHRLLDDYRFNKSREFFTIEPYKVKQALKDFSLEIKEIILDTQSKDKEVLEVITDEESRDRLQKFNFEKAKIKVGSKLYFVEDENIEAEVLDKTKIKCIFNNEEIIDNSSAVAKIILNRKNQPQGTLYWLFEGETLNQRWLRLLTEE